MAGANLEDILISGRLRPAHLQDGYNLLNGTDEDVYNVNLSTPKGEFETDRNTTIDTFRASVLGAVEATALTTEQKAALMASIDGYIVTMKASLSTDLDTNLPDSYEITISEVLAEAKTVLNTLISTYDAGSGVVYQYLDGRCGGTGRRAGNNEPADDPTNTTPIHCTSCDGLGRTATQNVQTVTWSVTTTL